jgi:hypothetical protein
VHLQCVDVDFGRKSTDKQRMGHILVEHEAAAKHLQRESDAVPAKSRSGQ